jgi:signal transduction histidine kinase
VYQTETTVRFIFEDIGPGLAADAQDVIFQPYGKTDDLVNGLGLGLPLAKRHALSLGGNITLDTTYHDGCRFIVEMPK